MVFKTISSDSLGFSKRNKTAALMLFLAALGGGVDFFFLSFFLSLSSQLQMRQCVVESGM